MLNVKLAKRFDNFSIDADFSVDKSGVIALFGKSGSGKTTIINMIAGVLKPSRGKIRLNGRWIFNSQLKIDRPPEKRRFGVIFQEGRLFPHLSVRANLNYGRKLLPESQRIIQFDQIVSLLEIESLLERRPSKLSGGEKQRVAIGRSLLISPALLLMDEPLASLDDECKSEVLPFIIAVSKNLSIPVVYVSHSLDEIRLLTDDIVKVTTRMVRNPADSRATKTSMASPIKPGRGLSPTSP